MIQNLIQWIAIPIIRLASFILCIDLNQNDPMMLTTRQAMPVHRVLMYTWHRRYYGHYFFSFFYSDNIISLDIHFEDLSYDEIEQIPVFENWTLACKWPALVKPCATEYSTNQPVLILAKEMDRERKRKGIVNEWVVSIIVKFAMQMQSDLLFHLQRNTDRTNKKTSNRFYHFSFSKFGWKFWSLSRHEYPHSPRIHRPRLQKYLLYSYGSSRAKKSEETTSTGRNKQTLKHLIFINLLGDLNRVRLRQSPMLGPRYI